ncbi:MAG: Ppx/GppA family phosphatase, partial [Bryobacteraceae bacterium]
DNNDTGHEQSSDRMSSQFRNGTAVVLLHGRPDTDLEQWAAENAGAAFRQVYDIPLSVVKARD